MERLVVDKKTGLVKKVNIVMGIVTSEDFYRPNGKKIFVDPKTNFLAETDDPVYRLGGYRKTNDFTSNSNRVIFHPDLQEFAEVKPAWCWGHYDKVRDLAIA